MQRTGVVATTPGLPPRALSGSVDGAGEVADIPDGLKPFCRPELDGRVMALVHENQVQYCRLQRCIPLQLLCCGKLPPFLAAL